MHAQVIACLLRAELCKKENNLREIETRLFSTFGSVDLPRSISELTAKIEELVRYFFRLEIARKK